MPENDFEKQVQQKMNELRFVPSDAVWPAVEKQIASRKKRRGLFFWLPLGALLLGSATWIFFSVVDPTVNKKETASKLVSKAPANNSNQTENIPATNNVTIESKKTAISKDSASKPVAKKTIVEAAKSSTKKDIATVKKTSLNKDPKNKTDLFSIIGPVAEQDHKKTTRYQHKVPNKIFVANPVVKKIFNKVNPAIADKIQEGADAAISSSTGEKDSDVKDGEFVQPLQETTKPIISVPAIDSIDLRNGSAVARNFNDSLQFKNETDSSKSVAKNKTTTKKKKRIEWGININAGGSSVSDGFSGLFSSTRSYDATAFLSNQQSVPGNLNGGSLSAAASRPSEIKPGFSYAAGMFMSVPLNKKFNFLTGLNYTYYSNSLRIGAKFNSIPGRYATGNLNNYTNGFHFIELPVSIQLHTARFAVNGGLCFSMLVANNTLLYNAQGNYYYSDNSLINKVQTGLLAGFSYRLFPKTLAIEIGPQFNYSLTNIFDKDLYGARHLFFGGINVKFFIHKK